ncbi:MAG: ComEC/Rec2 family competence protein [Actinobacteria bacterium]|nr:ComEC/Rec2 family competence protein [Actinomycetota bacterium]
MQRSETAGQAREHDLGLDLRPPVRLDLWALLLAMGIVAATVAPLLATILLLTSLVVSVAVAAWGGLVPDEWRAMAVLSPLFVASGAGIALLHTTAFDPLLELAEVEPGEVVVVGRVVSPPVPTKVGYRADVLSGVIYARGVWLADEERGWVGQVHRRTDAALGYGLRPREGAVVRGMVLGDSSRLPEEVEEAFRRSGITHVLAISGQHVAVLAAMIYVVLRLFAVPMLLRNPATLGLVWLYIFVAGAPPSAIRAGVVATFVLAAPLFGRQLSPLHFMTTMLAAVLAWNPLLVYSPGFQLSLAAVFGILLLRKPLQALVKQTVLRPFQKPPELLSNLLAVSLAAQIATTPIIATSFEEVSVIGVLTNVVAVPLSGPILTLGLLGTLAGNVVAPLAYLINVSNGFLVTVLIWVAEAASALPVAAVATPGAALPLLGLFYLGCVPAAVAEATLSEERWSRVAGLLVLWAALWILLVAVL